MRHPSAAALIALSLLCVPSAAHAKAGFGGFGHWSQGFMIGNLGGLDPALSAAGTLGEESAPGYAHTFGGGGRMLAFGGLVLGGRGYGLTSLESFTSNGSAQLTGGGGGLDVGWAFLNDGTYLAYPFVGVQGLGFALDLENNRTGGMTVGSSHEIPAGHSGVYQSGTLAIDVGMGMHQFLFDVDGQDGGGGFIIGGELGALVGVGGGEWTDADGATVQGLDPFSMTTFYLRMNVGGGGVSEK